MPVEHSPRADDIANRTFELASLIAQRRKVSDTPSDAERKSRHDWLKLVREASTVDLVEAVSQLTTRDISRDEEHEHEASGDMKISREVKALREAMIADIQRQSIQRLVSTMEQLDNSAKTLTIASFAVAVVGVLIAVIQLGLQAGWLRPLQ